MAPKRRECARCNKNRALKFFTANGTVCATCKRAASRRNARNGHLQATYGITNEDYEALLAYQNGACAICCGRRSTSYDVDHCHHMEAQLLAMGHDATFARRNSIRGLLCRRCNRRLLPASLDRTDILEQAIEYLTNPPADQVL